MILLVEVLAAEERIAVGRLHLEHAVADLKDRNVERAAAQIVDRDRRSPVDFFSKPIGQRGRGRLVDDAQHLKARDLAGVLGRLTLSVVEVGGDCDDRLINRIAEESLCVFLQLAQREGLRSGSAVASPRLDPGVAIVARYDLIGDQIVETLRLSVIETAAQKALDGEQCVFRVGHRLALGRLTTAALTPSANAIMDGVVRAPRRSRSPSRPCRP